MHPDIKRNTDIHGQTRITVLISICIVKGKSHSPFIQRAKHFTQTQKAFAFLHFFIQAHFIAQPAGAKSCSRHIFLDNFTSCILKNHPEIRRLFHHTGQGGCNNFNLFILIVYHSRIETTRIGCQCILHGVKCFLLGNPHPDGIGRPGFDFKTGEPGFTFNPSWYFPVTGNCICCTQLGSQRRNEQENSRQYIYAIKSLP